MKRGIPQGRALGPLLFLVYMNSLPSTITVGVLLQYADDTTLICSRPNPAQVAAILNHQLKLINTLLVENQMQLNAGKSCGMWFCSPCGKLSRSLPNITVNNITLKATNTQKYLGLIFDCHLTWKDHVAKVCKKMSYDLYLVNSNRRVLLQSSLSSFWSHWFYLIYTLCSSSYTRDTCNVFSSCRIVLFD